MFVVSMKSKQICQYAARPLKSGNKAVKTFKSHQHEGYRKHHVFVLAAPLRLH